MVYVAGSDSIPVSPLVALSTGRVLVLVSVFFGRSSAVRVSCLVCVLVLSRVVTCCSVAQCREDVSSMAGDGMCNFVVCRLWVLGNVGSSAQTIQLWQSVVWCGRSVISVLGPLHVVEELLRVLSGQLGSSNYRS